MDSECEQFNENVNAEVVSGAVIRTIFASPGGTLPRCVVGQNIFDNCVRQHLSGAGSSATGSVGRDLNLQKLNYQYLTTSVAVVLVVR